MRYKSNKKTINRKNRRTKRRSRKNNHSRKRYSKRLRKRYKSRKNRSRRYNSRKYNSRRHKRTRRKRKSLKGGMFKRVEEALGFKSEPTTGEKFMEQGRNLVQSVKSHISPEKTILDRAKGKVSGLGVHNPFKKKEKSHLKQLLHALETKLYPSMSAKLEHVEEILTKDVGFILSSLQKLAPDHFLEKIKLLQDTSELVCDYSHEKGKSFYDILNDPALTETAMKSTEAGKAFKVCNALHVCLKEKSSDQDFLHFDLFHLQFSMPFHQMMISFKEKTHQLLEGHEELKGFIAEVTDGYAHMEEGYANMKKHVEEKEKELMKQLKERLEIDSDQIKQLIREEIEKLEKEVETAIQGEEQRLAQLLVKIKESDTFKAFEGHFKEGEKHLEDIKECMQHTALTEQINAMHFERDKIQLFSLLMIGCMCVQTPLQVVQGIYKEENRPFEKREFKIMAMLLSGIIKTIEAIGNPDSILKITVQALNHTIQKNPTVINQNEEIQKLVNEYMADQTDQKRQTSDKLKIILSQGGSSTDEEERERFRDFVNDVVSNLVHHYKDQILGMLTDIVHGAATVGSLNLLNDDKV